MHFYSEVGSGTGLAPILLVRKLPFLLVLKFPQSNLSSEQSSCAPSTVAHSWLLGHSPDTGMVSRQNALLYASLWQPGWSSCNHIHCKRINPCLSHGISRDAWHTWARLGIPSDTRNIQTRLLGVYSCVSQASCCPTTGFMLYSIMSYKKNQRRPWRCRARGKRGNCIINH